MNAELCHNRATAEYLARTYGGKAEMRGNSWYYVPGV